MTIQAINVRNQFKGQIREIIRGDVLSEIDVQTAAGIVTSVITTRSVDELALQVGSEEIAFSSSTEVSIAKLCTRGAPDRAPYPLRSSVQKILRSEERRIGKECRTRSGE